MKESYLFIMTLCFFKYCLLITIYIQSGNAFSLLEWFYWAENDNSASSSNKNNIISEQELPNVRDDLTLISIPFEELSPEDKFLQEAERYSSISHSELDTCEHKVIMKLHSSCNDINEEELAKLSINLLNCQSQVSGKIQIECTDQMSLKDCTKDMDSEMWNAYHIINNRARAVCYAVRQQQFRALSEMAVNKLMTSALKQLTTMSNLEELQKELNLLTTDSLSSLREQQADLAAGKKELQLAELKVRNSIIANLRQLTQEKSLIQGTQNQLLALLEKITKEIENVGVRMESHSEQHLTAQNSVLSKLNEISQSTDTIWAAIEKKSYEIRTQQDDIKKELSETLENLNHINTTVSYLLNLVNQVRSQVDEHISWASNSIGADISTMALVVQHVLFLLAGVLLSLFLQLSLTYRLLLLFAVLTNIGLVYRRQPFSFQTLSAVIVGGWSIILLILVCWPSLKKTISRSRNGNDDQKMKTVNIDHNLDEDDLSTKGSSKGESISLKYNVEDSQLSFNDFGGDRSSRDRVSNSLSSLKYRGSISRADLCAAVCRNGQLCRSAATPGLKFCKRHLKY